MADFRTSPVRSALEATVVAVCGMQVEERLAAGARVLTICGGGSPHLLRLRLTAALADRRDKTAIVSFGIAGGLDPALLPGTVVLASRVVASRRWNADAGWLQALRKVCGSAVCADIAGSDHPIGSAAEKGRLRAATGAVAVDMESHIVAEIAGELDIPFAAIRVVADTADRNLPSAAMIPLKEDGRPDIAAVLHSLAARPAQLPALICVARDVRLALRSLGSVRRDIGVAFTCPYVL